jgi:hypothetical protein
MPKTARFCHSLPSGWILQLGNLSDGRSHVATLAPIPENLKKSTKGCYKGGRSMAEIAPSIDDHGWAGRYRDLLASDATVSL